MTIQLIFPSVFPNMVPGMRLPLFPPFKELTCWKGTDKMLGFLPGYHIYGLALVFYSAYSLTCFYRLVKALLFPISQGCSTVLMRNWDTNVFGNAVQKYKVTICPVVPPILLLLAKDPTFDKFDLSVCMHTLSSFCPLTVFKERQIIYLWGCTARN